MSKSIHIIANPIAGSAKQTYLSAIIEQLRSSEWNVSMEYTPGPNTAGELAKATTADIIAIAGGDGTIREVINGLIGEQKQLAIIPTGTANVLAAEIGLKKSADMVVSTITTGVPREFYVGKAGDTYFSAMASMGFDAEVVAEVNVGLKKRIGRYAYAWTALRHLVSYHPHQIMIEVDDQSYACYWALILNGRYYAGIYTCAPQASITEEHLYVCLLQTKNRLTVLRFALDLLLGRVDQSSQAQIVAGKHIHIPSLEHVIQGDGDIIGHTPLEIKSVPSHGLKILFPPSP